eukprot:756999-Hanusia_phi.AAC.4
MDKLEELREANKSQVKIYYTLDKCVYNRPPKDWKGFTGFVTEAMLAETMPSASSKSIVLMCGPPPMIDFAVRPNLDKLGFSKSQMLAF